jgi:hypothetical protein
MSDDTTGRGACRLLLPYVKFENVKCKCGHDMQYRKDNDDIMIGEWFICDNCDKWIRLDSKPVLHPKFNYPR